MADPSDLLNLHLDLRVAYDGSASLTAHCDSHARDLPLYVQAPVFAPPSSDELLQQLRHTYLSWDICDVLGDVSTCGHVIGCRFLGAVPPGSLPECSQPTTRVEAVLPDPPPPWPPEGALKARPRQKALHTDDGFGGTIASVAEAQAEGVVGWRVTTSPKDKAQEDAAGLSARLAASEGAAGSSWKGVSASMPFMPDGAPGSAAAVPACSTAIQEAESGAWLQQLLALQGGRAHEIPRVKAPGLSHGLFGAWECKVSATLQDLAPAAAAAAEPSTSGTTPRRPPASHGAGAAAAVVGASGDGGASSLFDNLWMLDADESSSSEEEVVEEQAPAAAAPAASALSRAAAAGATAAQHPAGGAMPEAGGAIDSILDATASEVEAAAARQLQRQESRAAQAAAAASTSTALLRMPLAGQSAGASAGSTAGQHEWAVHGSVPNLGARWGELKPHLALSYPFELDVFQKEAILHMEASRSVFVAAHTSAGKTVVAEYAFALATRHCMRAVYTSPIKTISNQKFRDFSGKFEVGLLTGDVQIKTSAPCLIMTTEILRSMLYRGADIIRDIEWVVFDEVHYVNDADRGVVWEEVIIMLPPHVNMVMLSATVPNVMNFADWIGKTKRKVIYVTGTTRRPVPLEHALYFGGEMYTISSREVYVPEGMRQATLAWKRKNEVPQTKRDEQAARPTGRGSPGAGPNQGGRGGGQARGGRAGGGGGYGSRPGGADAARRQLQGGRGGGANMQLGERSQLLHLVTTLSKRQLLPVAFFCFSKKRCDSSVDGVAGMDLTTSAEKHTIHVFVEKCLMRLGEEDRKLPQIARLRDLMRRGLAVHHAGLLPIMKEVVEMLFCQGYIKVLLCTETFAMGVNAPTRTVVFHSLRKHDGKDFRYLLPSEYTQMAGRAGRRGLDPVGTVLVACWEDLPPEGELRTMLTGRGVSLESRFRLTYSMILNLLRAEDLEVEDMLKRSFAEWRAQRSQPKALQQLEEVERRLARVSSRPWPSCLLGCTREEVEGYHAVSARIEELNAMLQERLMAYKSVQQALVPGRTVLYLNPVNGLTELALVLGDGEEAKGSGLTSAAKPAGTTVAEAPASSPDRKLYLLVLHRPGPVDHLHARVAEEGRGKDAAAAAAAAAGRASALADQFQGMVLRAPAQGGRGMAPGRSRCPGPLPRYGQLAGVDYAVVEAGSREVVGVCKSKLKVDTDDVLSGDWEGDACRRAMVAALRGLAKLQEEARDLLGEPQLLDWRADLKVTGIDTSQALAERSALMARRALLRPHRCPSLSEQYGLVRARYALMRARETLRHQLSDASLQQRPEFHQRVGVLQELGYLDADRAITLKGRVACKINYTQDELVASEMVFAGMLSDLSPEEAVALISALVFQEKSEVEPQLPPVLAAARRDLEALARAAGKMQAEHGLQIDPQQYVRDVMHCGLMQVVYEWARGMPFGQICMLTDVMEGSIVRAIVRLDRACRDFMDSARVMGNLALFQKMQSASAAIKRDVIFAASLYVS